MSVNPLTMVANHLMLSASVTIDLTELIAPLEGTLVDIEQLTGIIVEIEQLTGTIRCLNE